MIMMVTLRSRVGCRKGRHRIRHQARFFVLRGCRAAIRLYSMQLVAQEIADWETISRSSTVGDEESRRCASFLAVPVNP